MLEKKKEKKESVAKIQNTEIERFLIPLKDPSKAL